MEKNLFLNLKAKYKTLDTNKLKYNTKHVLKSPIGIIAIILIFSLFAFQVSTQGILAIVIFGAIPFIAIFLNKIFLNPQFGLASIFFLGFTAIGILRYMPVPIPLGLSIDGILILIYVSLFFKSIKEKVDWSKASNVLTLLAFIWFLYSLFELVNPEARSKIAWFYAMRGVSLYMLLLIPLVFILFDTIKSFQFFIAVWGILSLLGSLKGGMQLFFGPDYAEQNWLNAGAYVTHILFGKLRIFSFYSDAGQFGAAQGHTGLVFMILFFSCRIKKLKIFYLVVSLLGFWGMLISGTRGAIAAPGAGFLVYFLIKKNFKLPNRKFLVFLSGKKRDRKSVV